MYIVAQMGAVVSVDHQHGGQTATPNPGYPGKGAQGGGPLQGGDRIGCCKGVLGTVVNAFDTVREKTYRVALGSQQKKIWEVVMQLQRVVKAMALQQVMAMRTGRMTGDGRERGSRPLKRHKAGVEFRT